MASTEPLDDGSGFSVTPENIENFKRDMTITNKRNALDAVVDIPYGMVKGAQGLSALGQATQDWIRQRLLARAEERRSFSDNLSSRYQYGFPADLKSKTGGNLYDEQNKKAEEKLGEFDQAHPNATNGERTSAYEDAVNGDGLSSYAKKYDRATDKLTGATPREDRTLGDNLLEVGVQALIPSGKVPLLDKAGKIGKTTNKLLEKTDVAGLNLLDPRTSHFTPGGVALNAGAGSVVPTLTYEAPMSDKEHEAKLHPAVENPEQTVTTYPTVADDTGAPLNIVDATPKTPEDMHSPDKLVSALGVGALASTGPMLAAIFGMRFHGVGMHVPTPKVKPNTMSVDAGPVHVEAVPPKSSTKAYAWDEQSAVESDIARAHDGNTSFARAANTNNNVDLRSNAGQKVSAAKVYGEVDNMDRPITPVVAVQRDFERFTQQYGEEEAAKLNRYLLTRTSLKDRTDRLDALAKSMADKDAEITAKTNKALAEKAGSARQNQLFKQIQDLRQERGKLAADHQTYAQDLPEQRPSMAGLSTDEMMQIVKEGDANPNYQFMRDHVKTFNNDLLDVYERNGVMSPEDVAYLREKKADTHILLHNDPYTDPKTNQALTGASRAKAIFSKRMKAKDDEVFDAVPGQVKDGRRTPAVAPTKSRDLAIEDIGDRVNTPINAVDAMNMSIESAVRYIARNNYVKNSVDAMLAGAKAHEVIEVHPTVHGKPLWSRAELAHAIDKKFVNLDHQTVINRGGLFQVVTPKNPLTKLTFDQHPVLTVPILREAKQLVQFGATGLGTASFRATMTPAYDAMMLAMTRGPGQPGGVDALMSRVPLLRKSPEWVGTVARFAGNVTPLTDGAAIYLSSYMSAVDSFVKQNQLRLAQRFIGDFTNHSPVAQGLLKVLETIKPGLAETWGKAMLQHYKESLYYAAMRQGVISPADFHNISNTKRDYDKMFGRLGSKLEGVPGVGHALIGFDAALWQMRAILTSFESMVRMNAFSALARQRMLDEGVEHFSQLSKASQNAASRYARTATGDFSRVPGVSKAGRVVQMANSASAYLNVMTRSTQAIWRSMRENPKTFGAAVMSGLVMPRIAAEYILANWDDQAYQHWYEDTPLFSRAMYMPMITAAGLKAWYTGQPFDPDKHLSKSLLFPEARGVSLVMSEGLRSLGLYGKRSFGNNVSDAGMVSTLEALGEGLKQAFAPNVPSPIDAALKYEGVTLAPGNIFDTPAMIADKIINGDAAKSRPGIADPQAAIYQNRSGAQTTYNPTSNISQNVASVISALFGSLGGTITEAFDAFDQRKDDGVGAAAYAAVKAAKEQQWQMAKRNVIRSQGPFLNMFGLELGPEKIYRRTPTAEYIRDTRKTLDLVAGRNAIIRKGESLDNGGLFDQLANELKLSVARDPQMKEFGQQFQELNKQLKTLAGNRRIEPDARALMERQLMLELTKVNQQQSQYMQEHEREFKEMYGDEFKAKTGKEFSFQQLRPWLMKLSNKSKYGGSE